MAKKENNVVNEPQLTKEERYSLAKECIEKADYEGAGQAKVKFNLLFLLKYYS